jgi:hypothetical protein
VLSSRIATAFVLSKFIPTAIGCLVTMLLIPGLVAYGLLSWKASAPLDALRFLGALGIFWINLLFYLSLTLMLGLSSATAPRDRHPLALSFGQQMLIGQFPILARMLPYTLAVPLGDEYGSIAASILQGQSAGPAAALRHSCTSPSLWGSLSGSSSVRSYKG